MIRVLASIPLAAALAIALFSFMSWMIDIGPKSKPDEKPRLSYDLVMVEPDSETARRNAHCLNRQKCHRRRLQQLLWNKARRYPVCKRQARRSYQTSRYQPRLLVFP